jgi:hypothetical protein
MSEALARWLAAQNLPVRVYRHGCTTGACERSGRCTARGHMGWFSRPGEPRPHVAPAPVR